MKLSCLIILLASLFSSQRYYVWTYGNQMMEKGESEIEFYNTYYDYSDDSPNKTKQYIEFEVGMNDRLDAGIYFRYHQSESDNVFVFDGFKLKVRYRLFEFNNTGINPILYFESYIDPDFSMPKLEHKLILTKDYGSLNVAFNPTVEFKVEEAETEFELYSAISYKLNRVLRLGLECKLSEYGDYIGPTFSHGSENIFISLGLLRSIRKESGQADQMIRLILGAHL